MTNEKYTLFYDARNKYFVIFPKRIFNLGIRSLRICQIINHKPICLTSTATMSYLFPLFPENTETFVKIFVFFSLYLRKFCWKTSCSFKCWYSIDGEYGIISLFY